MAKPRVFIASSGTSYELVDWLNSKLIQDDASVPVAWKVGFKPGDTTIQTLINHADQCDLAVIFLTGDDETKKPYPFSAKTGLISNFAPRDNCVFEAGLFAGGLATPNRCMFVSSVSNDALPSDLAGVTIISMPEPGLGETLDSKWCEGHLGKVLDTIRQQIKAEGVRSNRALMPVLTPERLTELESELQAGESVVISSREPLEIDLGFASRVMARLQGQVRYRYFFTAGKGNAFRWIRLIQSLTLAGVARAHSEKFKTSDSGEIKELLDRAEYLASAKNAIGIMRSYLRIHLLAQDQEVPLRLCVHNAQSSLNAACYFRYTSSSQKGTDLDYFVLWSKSASARSLVNELLGLNEQTIEDWGDEIFRPSRLFNLYSKNRKSFGARMRDEIVRDIHEYFPDSLTGTLATACLGVEEVTPVG
jgi:predicted nucleotide-binding protein